MQHYKYILQRGPNGFLLRLPSLIGYDGPKTFTELKGAIDARNTALREHNLTVPADYEPWSGMHPVYQAPRDVAPAQTPHRDAEVVGVTADEAQDIAAVWEQAKAEQLIAYTYHERRQHQRITLSAEPVAIALLSDLHLGSVGTDYDAAYEDAETVAQTPGMYAGFHGDGVDNWIVGKLTGLQRGQAVSFRRELAMLVDWLALLSGKLLWTVSGNHDNWTDKLAGIDLVASALKGTRALYDPHQAVFDLSVGPASWRWLVRHKFRYASVYNPTHGLEVAWDRGDVDYDVAVAGHTHIATVCRPFYRHDKLRWAILTGTYKQLDRFGDECGFASPKGTGAGAVILWPDGRQLFIEDIKTAAAFLRFARAEHRAEGGHNGATHHTGAMG